VLQQFVLGFVALTCFFTAMRASSLSTGTVDNLLALTRSASQWFFALGFVATGMRSDLKKLFNKQVLALLGAYTVAQLIDHALSLSTALWMYG
jgi:uncharacterized membrane protein YadS